MKYVSTNDYPLETINRAESIFERFLGYSLAVCEYEETSLLSSVGFLLSNIPVMKIISVYGKTSKSNIFDYNRFYGSTDWVQIDNDDIVFHTKDDKVSITLPPSLFGTCYEEAKIKYQAGISEIPIDIENAILEIAKLIDENKIDEWNCFLPAEIIDTIDKYRKGA